MSSLAFGTRLGALAGKDTANRSVKVQQINMK